MAIKVLKYDQFGPYKGIQANLSAKIKKVGPKNTLPPPPKLYKQKGTKETSANKKYWKKVITSWG